jgi:hypothetical protein
MWANGCLQQIAANRFSTPQDVIAILLQGFVSPPVHGFEAHEGNAPGAIRKNEALITSGVQNDRDCVEAEKLRRWKAMAWNHYVAGS